jgi:hypothetical protein
MEKMVGRRDEPRRPCVERLAGKCARSAINEARMLTHSTRTAARLGGVADALLRACE